MAVSNITESLNYFNETDVFTTPVYIYIWVTILNVIVFLVGSIGNILVIFVVSRVREMKTSTNYCLMNLSIADLLVLIICQPAALLEVFGQEKWLLGDFMCKTVAFLENMVSHASILIIMAISLGRFYAVCYPLKAYSSGNTRRKMILIGCLWIVAAGWAVPFFLWAHTKETYHYIDKAMVDVCITPIDSDGRKAFVVLIFCVFFMAPLAMLIIVYIIIIFRVVKKTMSGDKDSKKNQNSDSHKQLVCMLVGIIILFFASLLPFRILVLLSIFSPDSMNQMDFVTYLNLMNFGRLLVYVNSAGNPLIYNIVSVKFRSAFRKALGCPSVKSKEAVRLTTMTQYSYMHKHDSVDPL
ncbi:hypothetical protein LOTGIDRAFT_114263 [Lottia gigantea]|uniref:G-protein coupled receptors family 1 profile domain-containing protein n=1 Tax=Lottia gigantea TaxID=225164 RepID=V4ATM1_LOTGI|nr:hypothetical protein LOTGIDRAFT_114263 [Lottia gigantea]ESO98260.1 hypothetical protein LOTGIDRAFT_114263 [Lottia gigantea]